MIGRFLFISWRLLELVTLIPAMGMLAYFVNIYNSANQLTPSEILTLFITSVLAVAWAFFTMFRVGSVQRNGYFCALIELGFFGALIASAYELRGVTGQDCVTFSGGISSSSGDNSITFTYNTPSVTADKTCSMLKACFAFAIMNVVFFFVTALIIISMNRQVDVRGEEFVSRRRHGSRRGHSSHSHRSRSSSRRNYYV